MNKKSFETILDEGSMSEKNLRISLNRKGSLFLNLIYTNGVREDIVIENATNNPQVVFAERYDGGIEFSNSLPFMCKNKSAFLIVGNAANKAYNNINPILVAKALNRYGANMPRIEKSSDYAIY